jgi:GNAT superfamily N-acetyltransferase
VYQVYLPIINTVPGTCILPFLVRRPLLHPQTCFYARRSSPFAAVRPARILLSTSTIRTIGSSKCKVFLMTDCDRTETPYRSPCLLKFSLLLYTIVLSHAMKTPPFPSPVESGCQRTDWKVRPATLNDRSAVEALLIASYSTLLLPDYDASLLATALPLMCRANDQLLTSSTWYVVEEALQQEPDDNTPTLIGCGGWTPHSPLNDPTVPHLRHFATHPNYTRKGVGRAIWDRTWQDWVKYHASGTTTTTTIRPDMEVLSTLSAQSFYESLGFVKVKEMVVPLSDKCPFPCILLRRPDDDGKSPGSAR